MAPTPSGCMVEMGGEMIKGEIVGTVLCALLLISLGVLPMASLVMIVVAVWGVMGKGEKKC